MPKKNDISGLLKTGVATTKEAILPSKPKPETKDSPKVQAVGKSVRVGRPKKSKIEKRDFKITLSLTQSEGAKILEKSGLADKATYLYDFLQKSGVFK